MEQQKKKLIKLYIWLFFGILLGIAIGLMKASGSFQTDCFFNQGEVYEFSPETLGKSSAVWYYDNAQGTYTIMTDNAGRTLPKISVYKSWSYISLNLADLNRESVTVSFAFYDKDKNILLKQENVLANGDNLIPIQYPEKFQIIKMIVRDQTGVSFRIQSMQLKDTEIGFSAKSFLQGFGETLLVYVLLTLLINVFLNISPKKWDWYAPVEILQYAYILFGNYLGEKWIRGLDKKLKSRIRKVLFWFLFTYTMIYQALDLYVDSDHYKYGILVSALILAAIGVFSWERPLHYVRWSGILPVTWLLFWVGVCISDLAVSKQFKFIGYVFLLSVGFFFFLWNHMEKPKQIRNDMIRGLECTFPVVVIYCMFFRQNMDGIFYNGVYHNRQDMALYALMMLIAFLSEIIYYMFYSSSKAKEKWVALYIVGAVLSIYFLWQTQVRTCLVAGGLSLGFFFYMWWKEKKIQYKKSRLIAAVICSVLVTVVVHLCVSGLPALLHTNLVYKSDRYDAVYEELQTEELDKNVLKKTRSVTEIHKKAIWKQYLRKLNLLGNEKRLIVYEKTTMAYNGFLEIAYRYGIFILIPYAGLLLLCLYRAVREGGYLMLATTLSFGMVMLTQNIEQPFAHPLWIVFYLGMGIWFTDPPIRKSTKGMGNRIYTWIKEERRQHEKADF